MRRPDLAVLGASLALVVAAPAAGQSVTALVMRGDPVPGVGNITTFTSVGINATGSWFVEARTNHADKYSDDVLLRDGVLYLREGQMLAEPAGEQLLYFDSFALDPTGRAGFNLIFAGPGGVTDGSGVYRDGALVIEDGTISAAPELTAGSAYLDFRDVKLDSGGNLYIHALVDDPNIASNQDQVIARFELDVDGLVLSEHVLWKEGDVLPGQTETVAEFRTDPHQSDVNGSGQVLFAASLTGDPTRDGVIYLDGALIAQEGDPSPILGRAWYSLFGAEMGVNDLGQVAFQGSLQGDAISNLVIIKDGVKLVQENDVLPAFAPFALSHFAAGPVRIGNDGRVLWQGTWDDPDTSKDKGLFLDHELIVQEGVTSVNGVTISMLYGTPSSPRSYALSRDGRYVIFQARLENGEQGVFLYDTLGMPPGTYCFGDGSGTPCPCGNDATVFGGCENSSLHGATLLSNGTSSVTADDLVLRAARLVASQPTLLIAGENRVNGGAGLLLGDGLRCAGMGLIRFATQAADVDGGAEWGPGLVAEAGFVAGDERHFQVWYRDQLGGGCGTGFNLSNGFTVTFAP